MSDKNDIVVINVGIQCPECGQNDWEVYRTQPRFGKIDRIRECKRCKTQIVTQESFIKKKPATCSKKI